MGSVVELPLSAMCAFSRTSEFSKGHVESAIFNEFDSRLSVLQRRKGSDLAFSDQHSFCKDNLLLGNVDDVVIRNSVDEFVIRIDASTCRHLVHDDLEALVRLGDLFFLEI
jgi:hypothetical protein